MAETEASTLPAHPLIGVDEVLERLGLTTQTSIYASVQIARDHIGSELTRAENWFKIKTGWTFASTETIDANKQSYMADVIYARVAYRIYNRVAMVRLDLAEHFRLLAKEMKDEFTMGVAELQKAREHSRRTPYPDDDPMHTIEEETDV
jgi:hypothetical protein